MTRSINKKKQSIIETLQKGKGKKQRTKKKGEAGCARLKALHRGDLQNENKAVTKVLNSNETKSMIGKLKFKLFGVK